MAYQSPNRAVSWFCIMYTVLDFKLSTRQSLMMHELLRFVFVQGDPVEEGSSWLWDPRYSDSSYLRQLALASPQPQLYQQQRLYHPPAPPPPNCRSLHCSTGGRSQCVKDIPPTDLSIHAPFPPAQPLPSSAGQCVSPTVPPQPEQLTTAASLYESPVAGSTNIPDGMDLEDSLSIVPLNFIESLQDDLFADLPPPSPSLLPLQSANVTPVRSETPQSDTHLPPDICDQSVPPSVVVQENSKTYEPSKSLPSGSAPLPSVSHMMILAVYKASGHSVNE